MNMNTLRRPRFERSTASLALAALLAACGGGGDDVAAGGGTAVTPATPVLTLSGTAATGAAIAGKAVEAKCRNGTGTAMTNADGSYSFTVASGTLPCVLKVTAADGTELFSVASGSGDAAVANINPVTQLVVASLGGTSPASYFGSFDASVAAAMTPTTVTDAVNAVKSTLLTAGLDLGTTDVLAGILTPATSTTPGNAYDQVLDALAVKLSSTGTTLADLTTTVAATSPVATAPTTTVPNAGTVSLPAAMLLLPKAAHCAALRSGTYRIVNPAKGEAADAHTGKIVIDAATLAVTYTEGSTGTWAATGEACHFTDDDGRSDILVSQAGVLVVRHVDDDGLFRVGIAFPEQTHTLAELAGTWNVIGMEANGAKSAFTGITGTVTLDGAGVFSAATWCQNDTTWALTGADCESVTTGLSTLKASATAGFESFDAGSTSVVGRLFAYQAGNGDLMGVEVDNDGSFRFYTRQRTNPLPTIGTLNRSWNATMNAQLTMPAAVNLSSNSIESVDTAAGSWARKQISANGAAFDYLETLTANSPRAGFTYRAAATSTATNGSAVTVREFNTLGLRGMGVSPVVIPPNKSFILTVNQP